MSCIPRILITAASLACVVPAVAAWGQPLPFPAAPQLSLEVRLAEPEQATLAHLARVDEFLTNDQWDEAVETLRRVMDSDDSRVVAAREAAGDDANSFVRYMPLREFCQLRLTRLQQVAPQAAAVYRDQVDAVAQRWFNEARESRNETLLLRVAEQMFASSYGDDACYLLGELALERGDFTLARACWERLSPFVRVTDSAASPLRAQAGSPLWMALRGLDVAAEWEALQEVLFNDRDHSSLLVYPDTHLDIPQVRARQVLVSILEGAPDRAAIELAVFSHLHPDAMGTIGGQQGKFVDLLSALLKQSRTWPTPTPDRQTATFAGSYLRHRFYETEWDFTPAPIWQTTLAASGAGGESAENVDRQSPAVNFPLVVGETVFITEPSRIRALKLSDGTPQWPLPDDSSSGTIIQLDDPQGNDGSPGHFEFDRHLTATVNQDRLIARLPAGAVVGADVGMAGVVDRGLLVGLDLNAQGKLLFRPLETEGANWMFEGTPILSGHRIYVSLRRRNGFRVDAFVACYEIPAQRSSSDDALPQIWRTPICTSDVADRVTPHSLLSFDGQTLYYNTQLGVVAAVAAGDGAVRWITRYPRASVDPDDPDRVTSHFRRVLTPCLIHHDMVIVAASDCDRLFALDAATGSLIWTTRPEMAADAVHLLGIHGRYLMASGQNLYWLDAYSGAVVDQFNPPSKTTPGHAQPAIQGFGRGLIAGDTVYWPTRQQIHIMNIDARRPQRQPIELASFAVTSGNLVPAGDVLLMASPTTLYAFK